MGMFSRLPNFVILKSDPLVGLAAALLKGVSGAHPWLWGRSLACSTISSGPSASEPTFNMHMKTRDESSYIGQRGKLISFVIGYPALYCTQ